MNNTGDDPGAVDNAISATPKTHIECALFRFHHQELAAAEPVTTKQIKDGAS